MKRRIFFFAVATVILTLLLATVSSATTYPAEVVFDRADLLTDDGEARVQQAIHDAWEGADCAFYLATHKIPSTALSQDRYFYYTGEKFLADHDISEDTDLILLVITLDKGVYYYDMYYYGDAPRRINDKEVNFILDHETVFDNIKGGALAEGAESFFALSAQAYRGRVGVSFVKIGVISCLIALAIGGIACGSVWGHYKMKRRSVDYPLDRFAKMELKEQNDVFVGSFVTKRLVQTNSGGGGGGGGGRGGGGGHAGGRYQRRGMNRLLGSFPFVCCVRTCFRQR